VPSPHQVHRCHRAGSDTSRSLTYIPSAGCESVAQVWRHKRDPDSITAGLGASARGTPAVTPGLPHYPMMPPSLHCYASFRERTSLHCTNGIEWTYTDRVCPLCPSVLMLRLPNYYSFALHLKYRFVPIDLCTPTETCIAVTSLRYHNLGFYLWVLHPVAHLSNWFLMMPSIATKFQYVKEPVRLSRLLNKN
jgi:hypothetical protein